MKKAALLSLIIAILISIFLLTNKFEKQTTTKNISAFISSNNTTASEVNNPEDGELLPVMCVLSYGTFEIGQQECDYLTQKENDNSENRIVMQCSITAGTFLVSNEECEILKMAKSSHDVMRRIDE